MKTILAMAFAITAALLSACTSAPVEADDEVKAFLQLLVQKTDPTLAEYARFSGEGDPSEMELTFEIKECRKKGWEPDSAECLNFSRKRWEAAKTTKSYYLSWIRKTFSTVGGRYRIVSVKPWKEGTNFKLVNAEINNNQFLLVRNTGTYGPPGVVWISEINGRKFEDDLKEDAPE